MKQNKCRFCGAELKYSFADLGMTPLANSYRKVEELNLHENYYPLHAHICEECLLVQLEEYENPEKIFSDYAYFSSFSTSWLNHAKEYCSAMVDRYNITEDSNVIEIASNDGYLLQYFKEAGATALGIEPAANVAEVAMKKGIPTKVAFFTSKLAEELLESGRGADLLIANNVLAHVPDLNDFIKGMKILLKQNGILTIEFPHLLKLIEFKQFDTIYHEHFSYFSFTSAIRIFNKYDLDIFNVDEICTHGGSLRIYIKHKDNYHFDTDAKVNKLILKEQEAGLDNIETYLKFNESVRRTKRDILEFLIKLKNEGKNIAAYGAPAKGNTLLNYCGIGRDFIDFTVDKSPHKKGLYLPGTHIPILSIDAIKEVKPDYIIILPWNLREEIQNDIRFIKAWGGQFVTLIPNVEVF